MALTGRAALAALIGVLAVLAFRAWTAVLVVEGLVLAGIVADLIMAAAVRPVRMTRSGDTSVRLGETASVTLVLENPGRRPLRGLVRDAWEPSARAAPSRFTVRIPGEGRASVTVSDAPQLWP